MDLNSCQSATLIVAAVNAAVVTCCVLVTCYCFESGSRTRFRKISRGFNSIQSQLNRLSEHLGMTEGGDEEEETENDSFTQQPKMKVEITEGGVSHPPRVFPVSIRWLNELRNVMKHMSGAGTSSYSETSEYDYMRLYMLDRAPRRPGLRIPEEITHSEEEEYAG